MRNLSRAVIIGLLLLSPQTFAIRGQLLEGIESPPQVVSIFNNLVPLTPFGAELAGTGILISPHLILTAAHLCKGYHFTSPRFVRLQNGEEIGVRRCRFDKKRVTRSNWDMGADVALLELATPISMEGVKLLEPEAMYETILDEPTLYYFGYGGAQTENLQLRGAKLVLSSAMVGVVSKWDSGETDRLWFIDQDSVAEPSDSGGPLLVRIEEEWKVLGVLSKGTDGLTTFAVVHQEHELLSSCAAALRP